MTPLPSEPDPNLDPEADSGSGPAPGKASSVPTSRAAFADESKAARRSAAARRFCDHAARLAVSLVGISSIAAILLVGGVLVWGSLPLLEPPTLAPRSSVRSTLDLESAQAFLVDPHGRLGAVVDADGAATVVDLETGEELSTLKLAREPPTCVFHSPTDPLLAFGFSDGTIQLVRVDFAAKSMLEDLSVPLDRTYPPLLPGESVRFRGGLLERSPAGPLVWRRLEATTGSRIPLEEGARAEVRTVYVHPGASPGVLRAAAVRDGGRATVLELRSSDPVQAQLAPEELPDRLHSRISFTPANAPSAPAWMFVSPLGDEASLFWTSGRCERHRLAADGTVRLIEAIDLLPDESARLVDLQALEGQRTFVAGDSSGRVSCWYVAADGPSAGRWLEAGQFPRRKSAVRRVVPLRNRLLFAAAYSDGTLALYESTGVRTWATANQAMGPSWEFLAAWGRADDGELAALSSQRLSLWRYRLPHASARDLYGWGRYENDSSPRVDWQTSAPEPKMNLWPLVVGSVQIALLACLWGCPLGVLSALYTTQFLHPARRPAATMVMEWTASIPGVVLGFSGAFLLAPFLAEHGSALYWTALAASTAIAAAVRTLAALPHGLRAGIDGPWTAAALGGAAAAAFGFGLGPALDRACFAGSPMRTFVDAAFQPADRAWFLLLGLPMLGLGGAWYDGLVRPRLSDRLSGSAALDLLTLSAFVALSALGCCGAAWCLGRVVDFRQIWNEGGSVYFSTLSASIMLSAAVAPATFLVAEEALDAVPKELRTASLAAGATPWQTILGVVLPWSRLGLAAAVLMGFSRAFGETMLVFVATGGGASFLGSPFHGARTLATNLLEELPEASVGTTKYHVLIFTALLLFAAAFVLNTCVELFRLAVKRKRV